MNPTRVSCIVPTRDRPALLAAALASVGSQTRRAHEVVVVDDDDGSSAPVAIAAANRWNLPLTFVTNRGPAGASAARNLGAARSTGDLLAFLDDDDCWHPAYLARSLPALEDGAAAVVTWMMVADGDGRWAERSIRKDLRPPDVVAFNPGVTGSNLVIRRAAFEDLGGFDETLPVSNDRDFFIRFLDAGYGYAVVEERLVTKRAHRGARLATAGQLRIDGYRAFLAKYAARMSPGDRRMMEAKIARVARASADRRTGRLLETVRLLWLAGPSGLRRLRAGRVRRRGYGSRSFRQTATFLDHGDIS